MPTPLNYTHFRTTFFGLSLTFYWLCYLSTGDKICCRRGKISECIFPYIFLSNQMSNKLETVAYSDISGVLAIIWPMTFANCANDVKCCLE